MTAVSRFPVPTVRDPVRGLATGPDGCIYYTRRQAVGRFDPNGPPPPDFDDPARTEHWFPPTLPPYEWGSIVLGTDGNLWFGGSNGRIGHLTVPEQPATTPIRSWRSQIYEVGRTDVGVGGLAVGSDGNVWFTSRSYTDHRVSFIGRIRWDGSVTLFPSGPPQRPAYNPAGITSGPDGALWFVERAGTPGGSVGRITTTGFDAQNLFPLPAPHRGPGAICQGPDGKLWFTASNPSGGVPNIVASIDLAGTVTEHRVPPSAGAATGICSALGDLWFSYSRGLEGGIGRCTTQGDFTLIPTPDSWPSGIIKGPDGNIWAGDGLEAVVRLVPELVGTK